MSQASLKDGNAMITREFIHTSIAWHSYDNRTETSVYAGRPLGISFPSMSASTPLLLGQIPRQHIGELLIQKIRPSFIFVLPAYAENSISYSSHGQYPLWLH